ncbi:Uncharacterized membrane protein YkvA, DUF1232 family [Marinobacter persicus]|uniref:Uncharacterized membrane protein YkvA, DUF1232 family n=1 Tax=Marinobacter persicus TaxID=930118 RepID=A0A1I3SWR2_9GAMM|nr:YkvA family protein [Marinobacter persicus]GHD41001.1 hypothetical protein GCM10008110_02480 [Marinobacter persicus]SFJ61886.1 Uncharacterized membrane protein YkvA, DUF1232 family [Marinobacter persicus]
MALFSDKTARHQLDKEARRLEKRDLKTLLEKRRVIEQKMAQSGRLQRLRTDIRLMFSLVRDYWQGNYRAIPWKSVAAIAGALLYLINPLDLIPDLIVGLGLLDDATIIAFCLKLVEGDLHRYAAWKEMQQEKENEQANH